MPATAVRLALAACLLVLAATARGQAAIEPIDHIVAVVENDVILASELEDATRTVLAQLRQQRTRPPPRARLERQVLERLIVDRLQLIEAEQTGIRVDDPTLNRAVADIAAKNGLSLDQFRQILERDGYAFDRFREDIRDKIAISRLQQREVESKITISEQEIADFLATRLQAGEAAGEWRLAQILVAVPEGASPSQIQAARREAEDLLARLRAGADFAELAVAASDGQSALQGGDLGWRKAEELPSFFAEPVSKLAVGEVSEPIRSPSGFHLVKVVGRRGDAGRHVITQTHVRHILVRTGELVSTQDARGRLDQLRLRIQGGDDFEPLARVHSDDAGSAARGGDLGWVSPGDLVPQFEEVMDRLRPGEVSEPFRSPFGWHIAQVLERRQWDNTEEVQRSEAREAILQRRREEELESWLRRLRDEAYVEIRSGAGDG
jgi:peptidyl-prolyl cis-trans isomerase SurA